MKKLTLGQIEWGMKTITFLTVHFSYSGWGISLLSIETMEYVQPWNYTETRLWHLFRIDYFMQLATFCTIRADIFLFGKQFAWKRKVEAAPDDTPF